MGYRAYRVTKFECDDEDAFNLTHDTEFMDFIEKDKGESELLHIPVEALQRALDSNDLKIDERIRKALKASIEWAKNSGEEWVTYNCA